MDAKKLEKAYKLNKEIKQIKEYKFILEKPGYTFHSATLSGSTIILIANKRAIDLAVRAILMSLRDQLRQKENEFKLL